jgi:hypothetical protein
MISRKEIRSIACKAIFNPMLILNLPVEFLGILNGLYLVRKKINKKFDINKVRRLRKSTEDVSVLKSPGKTNTIRETTIIWVTKYEERMKRMDKLTRKGLSFEINFESSPENLPLKSFVSCPVQ